MKKVVKLLNDKLSEHYNAFGYPWIPDREININEDLAKELIALIDKSIAESKDYVAEKYNIDVAHKMKHYDVIYD